MRNLPQDIENYVTDDEGILKEPKRPISALHSTFWKLLDMPIKRLVLDEAQTINKRNGVLHKALQALFYKAAIILSGTLAHSAWFDIGGYVDFIRGHPLTTDAEFLWMFSSRDYDDIPAPPGVTQLAILQKFLCAFVITRLPHGER